jgi:hypothetical protein
VGQATAIVVDGLRFPEDHAILAEGAGGSYLHIFVDADEQSRRQRYFSRSADGDFNAAVDSEVESQVESLRSLAHRTFQNVGTKEEIEYWASKLAEEIRGEPCQFPL